MSGYAFVMSIHEELCPSGPTILPEFAVAVGFDHEYYFVKSFRQVTGEREAPIPYDRIDAPGGPYVMAFPTPTAIPGNPVYGDRFAIGHALSLLCDRSPFRAYGSGLKAYDTWVTALEKGRLSDFGNAYDAQCLSAGRRRPTPLRQPPRGRSPISSPSRRTTRARTRRRSER